MSYEDVLAFVKENPVCFIATIDGDQPRVRGFLTVLFGEGKLYFTTGTMKNVAEHAFGRCSTICGRTRFRLLSSERVCLWREGTC